jgi:hypothetical protein
LNLQPKADLQVLFFLKAPYYLMEPEGMTEHCSTTSCRSAHPKRHRCPVNRKEYPKVAVKTVLHHITKPWLHDLIEQGYYFCDDPSCNVVYFGQNDSVVKKSELRLPVGIKEESSDTLVCYCFDVTKSDAIRVPMTKEYVAIKTREGKCSCETSNPSGRCCLKDFPVEYESG